MTLPQNRECFNTRLCRGESHHRLVRYSLCGILKGSGIALKTWVWCVTRYRMEDWNTVQLGPTSTPCPSFCSSTEVNTPLAILWAWGFISGDTETKETLVRGSQVLLKSGLVVLKVCNSFSTVKLSFFLPYSAPNILVAMPTLSKQKSGSFLLDREIIPH